MLMLFLANIVLFLIIQVFSFVMVFFLVFLMVIGIFATFMIGMFAVILFIILFLLYFILIITINSAMNGWSIYLSEKVIAIRRGGSFTLSDIIPDLRSEWKHYISKGFGILMFQIFILGPLIFIVLSPFFLFVVLLFIKTGYFESFLFQIAFQFLLMLLMLPLQPVIGFIFENGTVHIARGSGSWEGMFRSIKDIFKRRRLFGYFYPGYLLISLISMFLGPISILVMMMLPLLSKAYIVVNDDLLAGICPPPCRIGPCAC